ncbi:MAG: ankyrin repeat domain-containing protein, partial [Anaerolineales bacterium]
MNLHQLTLASRRALLILWVALMVGWATAAVARPAEDLINAASRGDAVAVQAMLARGVDINSKASAGATALIEASARGHLNVVQALLAKEADINAKMSTGVTALFLASQNGHLDVVQALL